MIHLLAIALIGQFSQIDTDSDGVPNIYRWLGATAEWRVGGTGSGFAGASGQCLMSAGPAATPAWGSCLAAGSAYSTIQEEGVAVTPRPIMNFIGASITAVDNLGTRTNVTLSQSPVGSTSVVGTGRLITSGNGLTGGGDLSADRTIDVGVASPITVAADSVGFDQAVALGNVARTTVRRNTGADTGSRRRLNFIEGANITITAADDAGNEEIDLTIAASGGAGSGDVVGPGSAADEAICRYDTTTGKLIQNSTLLLNDSGTVYRAAASGTDQPGTDIRLHAGAGTGAGQPGVAWISTPSVLGTGSTVQTLTDRFLLGGSTTNTSILLGNPDIDGIVASPIATVGIYATSGNSTNNSSALELAGGTAFGNADGGEARLRGGSSLSANPDPGGDVVLEGGDSLNGSPGDIVFITNAGGSGGERMRIDEGGNWILDGVACTSGQVPTSNGPGAAVTCETPAAGGGGSGNTTVNFGAFPADPIGTRVITGQAGILSGSVVQAWIYPLATADHTMDEHLIEKIRVYAHTIVAGTGFTITAVYEGDEVSGQGVGDPVRRGEYKNTRVGARTYGEWSVAWRWQ